MRTLLLRAGTVAGALLLSAGGAWAAQVTIEDDTLAQKWDSSLSPYYQGWVDVVGPTNGQADAFQTTRAEVEWAGTDVTLTLYTNFGQEVMTNGGLTVGNVTYFPADLAIDLDQDGDFETGIALSNHDAASIGAIAPSHTTQPPASTWPSLDSFSLGGLYQVSDSDPTTINESWLWSTDLHWGNAPFGGLYDQGDPKNAYTWMAYGTSLGTHSVQWYPDMVVIELLGVNTGAWNSFDLLWGTATCANDVIAGSAVVPEPATLILLGSGLCGIAGVARRRS